MDSVRNTPFYLVHGRDARLPTAVITGPKTELTRDAREYGFVVTKKIQRAFQLARRYQLDADIRRKDYYDRTHYAVELAPGSLVLLHRPVLTPGLATKLQDRFTGPYRVTRRLSDVTYELVNLETTRPVITHVQRILPYYSPEGNVKSAYSDFRRSEPASHDDGCASMDPGRQRRSRSTPPTASKQRHRRISCPELQDESGLVVIDGAASPHSNFSSRDGVDPRWPGDPFRDRGSGLLSQLPRGAAQFLSHSSISSDASSHRQGRPLRCTAGQAALRYDEEY